MICICGYPLMLHFGYALSIRSESHQRQHEALKNRDHHDFASRSVFLLLCTPFTIAISTSVRAYSSLTSASICRSAASICRSSAVCSCGVRAWGSSLWQGEHLFHLGDPGGGLRDLDLAAINGSTAFESHAFQNFISLPLLLLLRQGED